MISLDQVILLEKKVESAVAKIQQLKAENDALRSKCSELTNALSAKSEQLSSFVNDQSQIEDGIRKALDRLNAIENSVLKAASSIESDDQNIQVTQSVVHQATFQDLKPVTSQPASQTKVVQQPVAIPVQKPVQPVNSAVQSVHQTQIQEPVANIPDIYMDTIAEENASEESFIPDPADEIFDRPIGSFSQDYSDEIPEESEETESNIFEQTENSNEFDNGNEEQTDLGFDIF